MFRVFVDIVPPWGPTYKSDHFDIKNVTRDFHQMFLTVAVKHNLDESYCEQTTLYYTQL